MYRFTVTIGSRTSSIFDGSGIFAGFSTMIAVPSRLHDFVDHRGRGGDQVHIELALETFLHDFHVQQAQKPQRKPKPSACETSGSYCSDASFELQLFERVAQRVVLVRFDRIETGEHLRLHFLEARQRLGSRTIQPA